MTEWQEIRIDECIERTDNPTSEALIILVEIIKYQQKQIDKLKQQIGEKNND